MFTEKGDKVGILGLLLLLSTLFFGCTLIDRTDTPTGVLGSSSSPESLPATTSLEESCIDAEDGGNNPNLQGTLMVSYNGDMTNFTDGCATTTSLREYYCDGGEYRYYEKLCPYGCVDGACLASIPEREPVVEQPTRLSPQPEPVPEAPRSIPECFNGFRDLDETDVDCGGANCQPCGYGKHCKVRGDCISQLTCNFRSLLCLGSAS